ncbi:MAG: NADH-quinone oxidoreductase subunit C [Candidatus Bathyarchaeota archaeon]|nr:NADH-quinone oxidoreductase subunit C [Candidatus Bathyarchaeota archaeon]MDH5787090.1 NADH-quinone oxidoreductase subunit C [Candidatus Bathyarchaeota archaeon]
MSAEQIVSNLIERFEAKCFLESPSIKGKQIFLRVDKRCLKGTVEFLKISGFTHLSAITGLEVADGIELLYHLSNEDTLLTVRVKLSKNEAVAPSIVDLIRGAAPYEQEIHDFFGVVFEGHLNLASSILPDDWPKDNYPLRKTHAAEKEKTENKKSPASSH